MFLLFKVEKINIFALLLCQYIFFLHMNTHIFIDKGLDHEIVKKKQCTLIAHNGNSRRFFNSVM
jgi:hypothetical protein